MNYIAGTVFVIAAITSVFKQQPTPTTSEKPTPILHMVHKDCPLVQEYKCPYIDNNKESPDSVCYCLTEDIKNIHSPIQVAPCFHDDGIIVYCWIKGYINGKTTGEVYGFGAPDRVQGHNVWASLPSRVAKDQRCNYLQYRDTLRAQKQQQKSDRKQKNSQNNSFNFRKYKKASI